MVAPSPQQLSITQAAPPKDRLATWPTTDLHVAGLTLLAEFCFRIRVWRVQESTSWARFTQGSSGSRTKFVLSLSHSDCRTSPGAQIDGRAGLRYKLYTIMRRHPGPKSHLGRLG